MREDGGRLRGGVARRRAGPRWFATAYGVELLNLPGSDRIYLFLQGGSHTFRTIYLDGRPHPTGKDLVPSYLGHS